MSDPLELQPLNDREALEIEGGLTRYPTLPPPRIFPPFPFPPFPVPTPRFPFVWFEAL